MLVLGIAVAVALVLPLVTGGSYTRLVMTDWRWSALLFAGLGLQILLEVVDLPESRWDDVGYALLLTSYALIIAFCARNLLLRGMAIILIGVACNATVIAVNHGMPVDLPPDLRSEHVFDPSVKHHPQDDSDRLTFLGDIIVLRSPYDAAVSFGDLIIAVGLCDLTYHASRKRKLRQPDARHDNGAVPAARTTAHIDLTDYTAAPPVPTSRVPASAPMRAPAEPLPVVQPTALLVSPSARSSAFNTRSS